jgi:3'-phosphoadenosine 5'-phosphosulfate (PAPS) 3'-phosphatase
MMRLTPDDLALLAQYANTAARAAGEVIDSYCNQTFDINQKSGGDSYASQVVTEVDLHSEAAIKKALQPTCESYDLALLTEESTDDLTRLQKDFFWCIDPIDGTLQFIESRPGFAVSIGLVTQSGVPLIGVVYDPVLQTMYSSVCGQGVLRNGEPWAITSQSPEQNRPLTLISDSSLQKKSFYNDLINALEVIAKKTGLTGLQIFEKGGAVMSACSVLENAPAFYLKCPKPEDGGGSLWDFAATAAIFSEMNAVVCDFYGQPLELNRKDSTFMNHRGVIYASDQVLAKNLQGLRELCLPDQTL